MTAEDNIIASWGREFAIAVADLTDATGQDGYEVYVAVFGEAPMLDSFRAMTEEQQRALRDAARRIFETDTIDTGHVAKAVAATLWHWQG